MRSAARKASEFREESKKFFVNYFKQVSVVFGAAWNGRKYSIKSRDRAARVHPRRARRGPPPRSGARRSHRLPRHRPRDRALGPPHRRAALRERRRVEEPATTVDSLARELKLALEYPEGAGVYGFGRKEYRTGRPVKRCPILQMPAWLPPAFTAPCRKPQADPDQRGNAHAGDFLWKTA